MPFQKGQVANPKGRPTSEKSFAEAVRRAVHQPNNDGVPKIRALADKLVDYALAGEGWAFGMIADRLDGKPHQTSEMTITRRAAEMSDDELNAIAAGSGNGAAEPAVDKTQLN